MLCAYCGEREADRVDEHQRPVCQRCAELPEDQPLEYLEVAKAIIDRAIFESLAVN